MSSATGAPLTSSLERSRAGALLENVRVKMNALGLDGYIVPSDDPHLSEYVASAYARRAFLTNFKGSAGTAVVMNDRAYLWTDSRYFNEAGMCLDLDHWTLMKAGLKDTPTISKFLSERAKEKYEKKKEALVVGIDPYLHPGSFVEELEDEFASKAAEVGGVDDEEDDGRPAVIGKISSPPDNLIDELWEDQPPFPTEPFRVHPIQYAGKSVPEKIAAIQEKLTEEKATLCVVSALDDIAYFLNLRGNDVECNPVGVSYVIIHKTDGLTLYCDPCKVSSQEVKHHLESASIKIAPYSQIVTDLIAYAAKPHQKAWIDTKKTNYKLCSLFKPKQIIDKTNPIVHMKASKNQAELEGMRKAHLVDGVAMANFMSWLERELHTRPIDEIEIDHKLTAQRAAQPGYRDVSFPTIAAVASNGAIVHYRAKNDQLLKKLDFTKPILIDSGGQYDYGTTDVTRTWFFGSHISQEFKQMYTRVLKGNIMLDTAIFPENTPGFVLDAFARRSLWQANKEYGHGTGHGVGAALNVHEGPISISPRFANKEPLKPGMIVSNEPGYYKDGEYGIRIENLLEILPVPGTHDQQFLKFQSLTMIPIQTNLIQLDLMTKEELDWLDQYHATVWDKVGACLQDGSDAKDWLKRMCAKINRK